MKRVFKELKEKQWEIMAEMVTDENTEFGHINLHFFFTERATGERMTIYWDAVLKCFSGLAIRSQYNTRGCWDGTKKDWSETYKPYGWKTLYPSRCYVDCAEAVDMAKLLVYIEKELEKLSQRFGAPMTYGEFVARVFDILKVKKFKSAGKKGNEVSWQTKEVAWVINDYLYRQKEEALKKEGVSEEDRREILKAA